MPSSRDKIADALYLLSAGADEKVFLDTLQAYVAVNSKTEEQVANLLKVLQEANPTVTSKLLLPVSKKAAKKPPNSRHHKDSVKAKAKPKGAPAATRS